MRLRLTVRRHHLPDTLIIWVVDTTTSPTIAQLLEQVNDAVPIESGEWGYEDYAVEVKGNNGVNYECLHYQSVSKVMKEDDEVVIRPLLTQDLKVRRISGRIQISADGKHLVDGLAFGRPLLRRLTDRPTINIPSRKRRRITYPEEDEAEAEAEEDEDDEVALAELENHEHSESDDDQNKQLVLHADFDEDSDEDDDDFAPGGDDESEDELDEDMEPEDIQRETEYTDEELQEQQDEEPQQEQDDWASPFQDEPVENTEDELAFADVPDEATRTKIRVLNSAFPKSTLGVCKLILVGTKGDMGEAYEALTRGFIPTKPKSAIAESPRKARKEVKSRKSPPKMDMAPAHESDEDNSMEVDSEPEDPRVEHHDKNGFRPGSIADGSVGAGKRITFEDTPTRSASGSSHQSNSPSNDEASASADPELSNGLTSTPFIDQESQEIHLSSSDSSDDSSEEDSDSSSESDSDSGSDSSENASERHAETSSSSSDSESDSSSDSSSDDDAPEEASSKVAVSVVAKQASNLKAVKISTTKSPPPKEMPPGKGRNATRARNSRRKANEVMTRYKEKGILPDDVTIHEFLRLGEVNGETTAQEALVMLTDVRAAFNPEIKQNVTTAKKTEDFEIQRRALLASLSSGGIEVNTQNSTPLAMDYEETAISQTVAKGVPSQSTTPLVDTGNQQNSAVQKDETSLQSETLPITETREALTPETTFESHIKTASTPAFAESSQSTSARRAKLDLGAGRRLLFGALGVKAPKTKQDEEKLRNDLMKSVRQPKTREHSSSQLQTEVDIEEVAEDPDAWKEKINYRAVECVQEDIELSVPLFPFVQRWDPQQRWTKNGKRKMRDQAQYYNDTQSSKKRQKRGGKHDYAEQQEYLDASYQPSYQEDSIVTDYEDPSQLTAVRSDIEEDASQQLLSEQMPVDEDQEPDDLALLPNDPSLLPDLVAGQAKVGMTIAFKRLDCSPATKWEPQMTNYLTAIVIDITAPDQLHLTLAVRDRKQANYDSEGERVYDKFEMQDDEEDDGALDLSFHELYEPKIVQEPPASIESRTWSHEEESQEAQLSHVIETPLQSDAPQPEDEDVPIGLDEAVHQPSRKNAAMADLVTDLVPDMAEDVKAAQPTGENVASELNDAIQQLSGGDAATIDQTTALMTDLAEVVTDLKAAQPSDEDVASEFDEAAQQLIRGDAAMADLTNPEAAQPFDEDVAIDLDEAAQQPTGEDTATTDPITNSLPLTDYGMHSEASQPLQPPVEVDNVNIEVNEVLETVSEDILPKEIIAQPTISSSITSEAREIISESPGDAAVFEKLLNEMTERSSIPPFSPRFNGLGLSSPVRRVDISEASTEPQVRRSVSPAQIQSSWVTVDPDVPSSPPQELEEPTESMDISGWVTDNGESSSPVKPKDVPAQLENPDTSSWITDPEDESSNPPTPPPVKQTSVKKTITKKVPVGRAEAMWQQLRGKQRRNTKSPTASVRSSPVPQANDKDTAVVEYPKLVTGSSFTSQITDHGHQPDFDDSVTVDAPVAPEPEVTTPKAIAQETHESRRTPTPKAVVAVVQELHGSRKTPTNAREEPSSHRKAVVNLPPQKSPISARIDSLLNSPKKTIPSLPREYTPFSDDDSFPTLEEVLSQHSVRRETSTPVPTEKITKVHSEWEKAVAKADEEFENSDTTPKASRNHKQKPAQPSNINHSESRTIKSRTSVPPTSQPRIPDQPLPNEKPQSSQFIDLTMSSDVEVEVDVGEDSDDSQPFINYDLDVLQAADDNHQTKSGWAPKKTSEIPGVGVTVKTERGAKGSSQVYRQNRGKNHRY